MEYPISWLRLEPLAIKYKVMSDFWPLCTIGISGSDGVHRATPRSHIGNVGVSLNFVTNTSVNFTHDERKLPPLSPLGQLQSVPLNRKLPKFGNWGRSASEYCDVSLSTLTPPPRYHLNVVTTQVLNQELTFDPAFDSTQNTKLHF